MSQETYTFPDYYKPYENLGIRSDMSVDEIKSKLEGQALTYDPKNLSFENFFNVKLRDEYQEKYDIVTAALNFFSDERLIQFYNYVNDIRKAYSHSKLEASIGKLWAEFSYYLKIAKGKDLNFNFHNSTGIVFHANLTTWEQERPKVLEKYQADQSILRKKLENAGINLTQLPEPSFKFGPDKEKTYIDVYNYALELYQLAHKNSNLVGAPVLPPPLTKKALDEVLIQERQNYYWTHEINQPQPSPNVDSVYRTFRERLNNLVQQELRKKDSKSIEIKPRKRKEVPTDEDENNFKQEFYKLISKPTPKNIDNIVSSIENNAVQCCAVQVKSKNIFQIAITDLTATAMNRIYHALFAYRTENGRKPNLVQVFGKNYNPFFDLIFNSINCRSGPKILDDKYQLLIRFYKENIPNYRQIIEKLLQVASDRLKKKLLKDAIDKTNANGVIHFVATGINFGEFSRFWEASLAPFSSGLSNDFKRNKNLTIQQTPNNSILNTSVRFFGGRHPDLKYNPSNFPKYSSGRLVNFQFNV